MHDRSANVVGAAITCRKAIRDCLLKVNAGSLLLESEHEHAILNYQFGPVNPR